VRLNPRRPQARAQLGFVFLLKRQHDAAIAEFERLRSSQFNRPSIRLCLDVCGRAGKSDRITARMRFDPFALPPYSSSHMAWQITCSNEHPEAVPWFCDGWRMCPCAIFGSRPPMRSWDKLRGQERGRGGVADPRRFHDRSLQTSSPLQEPQGPRASSWRDAQEGAAGELNLRHLAYPAASNPIVAALRGLQAIDYSSPADHSAVTARRRVLAAGDCG
jgi:hypothetical protein